MLLTITGHIRPKARPRRTNFGVTSCPDYRSWKENAIAQLRLQLPQQYQIVKECSIEIWFYGALRGDIDNLAGAILDALVQADVIEDDRLSLIKELKVKHEKRKEKGCDITITPVISLT